MPLLQNNPQVIASFLNIQRFSMTVDYLDYWQKW